MARRADWDYDDDFEILNQTSPIQNLEDFEIDSFELIPCTNNSPSLVNTTPIQHNTNIEKPITVPIPMTPPIVDEVKPSLENSSTNFSYLPIRYGSAAKIPYDNGFDLKSILNHKSPQSNQINDLMNVLQNEKNNKHLLTDNNLQQVLIDNTHTLESLVQTAKQIQQDFIQAIHLD